MGKYRQLSRQVPPKERPWEIHPIWRAIGCLLLILIPAISYAAAVLIVERNTKLGWLYVPRELTRTIIIPGIGLAVPHLYANLLAGVVIMLIGFGVLMVVYSLVYSLLGPSRYGPVDSPPVKPPSKRRK